MSRAVDPGLADPGSRPARPLGRSRAEVLAALRTAGEAGVAEVAEAAGLHVNTARFHLDALVEEGYAERHAEPASGPGRPRILYRARAEVTDVRSYRLLAQMLGELVARLDPQGSSAAEAGRMWGHQLVEGPDPAEAIGAEESLRRLRRLMADIGFEPELAGDGGAPQVRIHHCPFHEVARQQPGVVCAVHLGLVQGALEELGGPLAVDRLDPFVTEQECVLGLRQQP